MAKTEEEKRIARREANKRYREKNPNRDKEYYEANKESILAKQKERYDELRNDPDWVARQRAYKKKYQDNMSEEQRQHRRDWEKEYRQRSDVKKKQYAHQYVKLAVMFGDLERPTTCADCGKECKPEAHHENYDKPLDVIWLCKSCHVKADKERRVNELAPQCFDQVDASKKERNHSY